MAPASITDSLARVLSRFPFRTYAACSAAVIAVTVTTIPAESSATGPLAAPATGRIDGTVRLVAPPGAPIPSGAYPSRRVSRLANCASEVANVVGFVKHAPRAATLAAARAQMRQEEEAFAPRLVAVTRGSTVEFPNAD